MIFGISFPCHVDDHDDDFDARVIYGEGIELQNILGLFFWKL